MNLIEVDNGGISSIRITHLCTGIGCCARGRADALHKTVCAYLSLFSSGYSAPLLVRWKHAEKSQQFLSDGVNLHGVLAKTLQHMHHGKSNVLLNELLAAAVASGHGSNEEISALEQAGVDN
jgi:hypothetical protein